MDRTAADTAIAFLIREISTRLDRAAAIGKAAQTCAEARQIAKSVEVALDIEQLCYETSRLLDAASLIYRISAGGT